VRHTDAYPTNPISSLDWFFIKTTYGGRKPHAHKPRDAADREVAALVDELSHIADR
jgi:hypothetical protein